MVNDFSAHTNFLENPNVQSVRSIDTYSPLPGRLRRTGRIRAPALNGRTGVKFIEAKVVGSHHLRQHDDLTGVHREVFRYVEDSFKDAHVVALDFAILQER